MSSAASSRSFYVVVLEHELSDGYESYYCPNLKTAKAVLQSAYQAGARVVRFSGGPQAAQHSYPLDITVLTDTDDLPF